MIFAGKKYIKCIPQQYQKIYYERTRDPIGYIKKQSGLDLSGHATTKYGADALKEKKVQLIEYYGKAPR